MPGCNHKAVRFVTGVPPAVSGASRPRLSTSENTEIIANGWAGTPTRRPAGRRRYKKIFSVTLCLCGGFCFSYRKIAAKNPLIFPNTP
jgi:hypothetical protein